MYCTVVCQAERIFYCHCIYIQHAQNQSLTHTATTSNYAYIKWTMPSRYMTLLACSMASRADSTSALVTINRA